MSNELLKEIRGCMTRFEALTPDLLQSILDLCQYFRQKKLKGYAAVLSSSSSFCCGVI